MTSKRIDYSVMKPKIKGRESLTKREINLIQRVMVHQSEICKSLWGIVDQINKWGFVNMPEYLQEKITSNMQEVKRRRVLLKKTVNSFNEGDQQ